MLELPRELYLMICSYLEPTDLTKLAGVSRDTYLAVQQPLYARINITAYASLIKLVNTLQRVPVVSHISSTQRLRWFKLADSQLRERDIKYLDLVLDHRKDGQKITGAIVANCIGAIGRKCYTAQITLTLNATSADFVKQLERLGLPNVVRLALFLGSCGKKMTYTREEWSWKVWELVFSGLTFPDLRKVYVNTYDDHEDEVPDDLFAQMRPWDGYSHAYDKHRTAKHNPPTPFHGLGSMQEIVLAHNSYLDASALQCLFESDIIPGRLTKLEIVDCPALHPVKHLTALSTLLRRALQLVRSLKLHLCDLSGYHEEVTFNEMQYGARINKHPEEHLCNVIRELGQTIPSLDLAVPFICDRIFPPLATQPTVETAAQGFPQVPLHPFGSLPGRIRAEGYKHRQLYCLEGICRAAHSRKHMAARADMQTSDHSWLLLHLPGDHGSWHLSGYSRVKFSPHKELTEPYNKGIWAL